MNEIFGAPILEPPAPKMILAPRAINFLEMELSERQILDEACNGVPMVFFDGDAGELDANDADNYESEYGERLSAQDAMALRAAVHADIAERYRRQLIIAREFGPGWGSEPEHLEIYRLACATEGVDPII